MTAIHNERGMLDGFIDSAKNAATYVQNKATEAATRIGRAASEIFEEPVERSTRPNRQQPAHVGRAQEPNLNPIHHIREVVTDVVEEAHEQLEPDYQEIKHNMLKTVKAAKAASIAGLIISIALLILGIALTACGILGAGIPLILLSIPLFYLSYNGLQSANNLKTFVQNPKKYKTYMGLGAQFDKNKVKSLMNRGTCGFCCVTNSILKVFQKEGYVTRN